MGPRVAPRLPPAPASRPPGTTRASRQEPTPAPQRRPKYAGPFLDPVCRELVRRRKVHWRIVENGVRYYFCCATCKRRFAREPGAYADGAALARAHLDAIVASGRPAPPRGRADRAAS